MSLLYIRKRFGVPAKLYTDIRWTDEKGKVWYGYITGSSGGKITARLDGRYSRKELNPIDPNLIYLDENGIEIERKKKLENEPETVQNTENHE